MANYDDLVSRVAIHVSPCPEKVILDAVREVVRDFCMKTKGWVHDCPAIEVDPTQTIYDLDVPEGSATFHIWSLEGRTGQYKANDDYFINLDGKLQFNEAVRSSKTIKPLVSLIPTGKSEGFPDYIVNFFEETIVSGAVAELQQQPFRDWSQPNAVGIHLQKYEQGLAQAQRFRDEGLNKSKVRNRVKPHYI